MCETKSKTLAKSKYKISTDWPASSAFVESVRQDLSVVKSMLLQWYNIVSLEMFSNIVLNDGFNNFADETNRTVVVNSSAISLLNTGVTRAFSSGLEVLRTPKTY